MRTQCIESGRVARAPPPAKVTRKSGFIRAAKECNGVGFSLCGMRIQGLKPDEILHLNAALKRPLFHGAPPGFVARAEPF